MLTERRSPKISENPLATRKYSAATVSEFIETATKSCMTSPVTAARSQIREAAVNPAVFFCQSVFPRSGGFVTRNSVREELTSYIHCNRGGVMSMHGREMSQSASCGMLPAAATGGQCGRILTKYLVSYISTVAPQENSDHEQSIP